MGISRLQEGVKAAKYASCANSLAAIVMQNAHVTMNGGNTCKYFACTPPSVDEWIKNGLLTVHVAGSH